MAPSDSVSANGSPPTVIASTSPLKTSEEPQPDERSVVTWSGITQGVRERHNAQELVTGNVSPAGGQSNSLLRTKTDETYELKDWPRKGGRLKAVVNTVRSFRRNKLPAAENTSADKEAEMKSENEAKNKPRSTSLIRKKFAFLKDRRQRSVSESQLGVMYKSRDDLDLTWENDTAAKRNRNGAKKLVRRSSENITGSTTLSRQRSAGKYSFSLPNSPVTAMSGRGNSTRFVAARNSRSTASCSSNSRTSSPTHSQEKCRACDFDVLILTECPDCQTSQQDGTSNHSFHERLIT